MNKNTPTFRKGVTYELLGPEAMVYISVQITAINDMASKTLEISGSNSAPRNLARRERDTRRILGNEGELRRIP